MILISYVKPNVIINSDNLMTGKLKIYDEYHTKIFEKELYDENFVSIGLTMNRTTRITIEITTIKEKIVKHILI